MAGNFSSIRQRVYNPLPSRFDQRVSALPYLHQKSTILQQAGVAQKYSLFQFVSTTSSYATRAKLHQRVNAGDSLRASAKVIEVMWHD